MYAGGMLFDTCFTIVPEDTPKIPRCRLLKGSVLKYVNCIHMNSSAKICLTLWTMFVTVSCDNERSGKLDTTMFTRRNTYWGTCCVICSALQKIML